MNSSTKPRRRLKAILLIVLLYFIVDRGLMYILYRTPGFNLVGRTLRDQQRLKDFPEERGLLIIGDSRVRWTMDPRILAPALGLSDRSGLNMALPASRLGDDLACLHWLESQGLLTDTRTIIWGIGFGRFHRESYSDDNAYIFFQPAARAPSYMGFTDAFTRYTMASVCARTSLRSVWEVIFPPRDEQTPESPQKRRDLFTQLFKYQPTDYNELGFLANNKDAVQDIKFNEQYYSDCEISPDLAARIIAAIRQLKAAHSNLRIVVLETPVSPQLQAWFEKSFPDRLKDYDKLLGDMRTAGAEVLRPGDFKFHPTDYTDETHMTDEMAQAYMKELAQKVRGR